MEKVDYSKLINEIEAAKKAPVVSTYAATVSLNILSESAEIAKETLELLANSFGRFSDIEVTGTEMLK